MYIKLTPASHTSTDTFYASFIGELKKVLDGTVTSVSGLSAAYVDLDFSEISGTAPTAGIYSNFSFSGYVLSFNKKYYHQATGFTPSINVIHNYHTSYGAGWRMYRLGQAFNGADAYDCQPPMYGEERGWTGAMAGSGDSALYSSYVRNSTGNLRDIHVIYRDDMFMVKYNYARNTIDNSTHQSTNSNQEGTAVFMINDLEYQAGMDDIFFNQYNNYCPSVCSTIYWGINGLWNDLMSGQDFANVTNNDAQVYIGKTSYPNSLGQFKNHSGWSQSHNGASTVIKPWNPVGDDDSENYRTPAWYPPMHRSFPPFVGASGSKGYQMIPVQYDANAQSSTYLSKDDADVRYGTFMNLYRTTNNITKYDGQSFVEDGVTYRTFRMHACGHQQPRFAKAGACYAIPE